MGIHILFQDCMGNDEMFGDARLKCGMFTYDTSMNIYMRQVTLVYFKIKMEIAKITTGNIAIGMGSTESCSIQEILEISSGHK